MEGIRVYVPDEKLVWVPATVLSVDANGQRFRVRVDAVRHSDPDARRHNEDGDDDDAVDAYVERDIDLRDDGMPDALPLQNTDPASDFGATKTRIRHDAIPKGLDSATTVGAEDMCQLSHLHEPAIVYNVRARFFAQAPYTYTGKIVVAVNPYQWIKSLYSEALRDLYTQHSWDELPPHVYATSAEAFHNMKNHKIPQSILVSGESGAGKTETVKIMMEHLASISISNAKKTQELSDAQVNGTTSASAAIGHDTIVQKVLKSNPLLEAFGNAKTIRNDNSSRFGKFTQLQFNTDYCLIGAECRHYLLEKSRVIAQAAGERNYHVFYQLVSAREERYGFSPTSSAAEFRYLQDEPLLLDGQTDLERYQVTRDALTTIGLSDTEQDDLFHALCGILRLGQLDFVPLESNKNDASQPMASLNPSAFADNASYQSEIENQKREIEQCAKLLGVEVAALSQQLCSRSVKARQEVYCVPLSNLQASNNRDALAKEVYARVFAYLVRRVNYSISESPFGSATAPSYMHIDLLDIFGFESFQRNSFEQFCINFANEKLQQKFTLDVFKTVQEEYQQEEIQWEFITYRDNQDMLDLLENSMGLMALLNEECVRPKGSDVSFASKIVSLHEANPRLEKARLSQTHFVLHHYAGAVTYDAAGFVEKNKDSLQSDLLELLATSSNGLIAMMFGARASTAYLTDDDLAAAHAASMMDDGGRRSTLGRKTSSFMQETVSYKFKAQLALLMSDISSTEVHYVRCIKPNSKKSPHVYEIDSVVNQLRCAGVVEAIRITRAAFPNKMAHEKFLRRFVFMKSKADPFAMPSVTVSQACEELAQHLLARGFTGSDEAATTPLYVVGRSLIYFGKDVLEYLERTRTIFVHDRAILIQRTACRWVARKRMMKVRRMITKLQAIQRRRSLRQKFLLTRRRCVLIQSIWRGVSSRQRSYLLMKETMAIRIQSLYRRHREQKRFARFRNAVVKMQSQLKMKKQVGKYKLLLSERKEQAIMENEVELLKRRLEEEKQTRLEIEAQNTSLQQELYEVRHSTAHSFTDSDLLPPYGANNHHSNNNARSHRTSERESVGGHDDSKLLDDSERMIDYLRNEVTKGRELIHALSIENENLKAENKKVKDAYTAAGASFAALNQHNKQQSKANLRLMSTHAALIKSQEEKMKKYQKQIADLKEDLKMQRNVYSAELMARVQQQDVLLDMINIAESYQVPEDLLERMRAMALDSKPAYSNGSTASTQPSMTRSTSNGNRASRSDTISSTAPVPVSVGNSGSNSSYQMERRSTIDAIMNNPVRSYNAGDHNELDSSAHDGDRASYIPHGRTSSVYYDDENRHRKSRIGGMFKKMFKKENSET
uniref:Myosin motor domain-containing protein n=1 Tax=Globisporangium ultimum (strain ATCC 200006 / CBS 805.95 / DAOM BR144) TaxID=431595 RepID=K3X800_GLOUD